MGVGEQFQEAVPSPGLREQRKELGLLKLLGYLEEGTHCAEIQASEGRVLATTLSLVLQVLGEVQTGCSGSAGRREGAAAEGGSEDQCREESGGPSCSSSSVSL